VNHRLTATPIAQPAGAAAATLPTPFVLRSWWPWAVPAPRSSRSASTTAAGIWAASTATVE
jgi:hypothetical protein